MCTCIHIHIYAAAPKVNIYIYVCLYVYMYTYTYIYSSALSKYLLEALLHKSSSPSIPSISTWNRRRQKSSSYTNIQMICIQHSIQIMCTNTNRSSVYLYMSSTFVAFDFKLIYLYSRARIQIYLYTAQHTDHVICIQHSIQIMCALDKSRARLQFDNLQCLPIWLLTFSVLGAPVEELCALARKVHILKSQHYRHCIFHFRPRMENSHSGRPRTAEYVVKCVTQNKTSPMVRANGTIHVPTLVFEYFTHFHISIHG